MCLTQEETALSETAYPAQTPTHRTPEFHAGVGTLDIQTQHSPETLIPRELLPIPMPSSLPTLICHYLSPAVEIVLRRPRAFKMAALLSKKVFPRKSYLRYLR